MAPSISHAHAQYTLCVAVQAPPMAPSSPPSRLPCYFDQETQDFRNFDPPDYLNIQEPHQNHIESIDPKTDTKTYFIASFLNISWLSLLPPGHRQHVTTTTHHLHVQFTSVAVCPQISTVGPKANEDHPEPGNILPIKLKKRVFNLLQSGAISHHAPAPHDIHYLR